MPLYEYECTACRHRLERIQKFGARAPRCPECGGSMKRLLSSPAIQFKGEGWYVTDYARKGKKDGGSEGKAAGEGKAGGESKATGGETSGGEKGKDAGGKKASGGGKKDS